uniref:Uncharacterized protein n=1 Tax=Xiphophorus maculatus TaxID=8083 RepID=A0A3B5QUW8_XIPMA
MASRRRGSHLVKQRSGLRSQSKMEEQVTDKAWESMPTSDGSDEKGEPKPGPSGSSASGSEFLTLMKDFMTSQQKREKGLLKELRNLRMSFVCDSVNKGAKISSVAGSSVGAVGGIMSITDFALIPFTAAVSLRLTVAGAAVGGTSAVNSLVTTAVEGGVNHTQTQQANTAFQRFMFGLHMAGNNAADGIEKAGELIVDAAAAVNAGKVILQEGKALGTVSRMASDVPGVGQAAVKGSLAITKGARAGFIAANALFLGVDIYFITTDSLALAEGTETKVSKFLRARAALWLSEIEAWGKICNSLSRSKLTTEEIREMLEKPFYPVSWKQFTFLMGHEYVYWAVDTCKW